MQNKFISIGFQCTVPIVLNSIGKKQETLPFDWMLNTPEFVYKMLEMLLSEKPITELVNDEFFLCNERVSMKRNSNGDLLLEQFSDNIHGKDLFNRKYGVVFPHDKFDSSNIEKYERRFERLKSIILNKDFNLTFVYISPSSINEGNFIINDKSMILEVNYYLNQIVNLLSIYRKDFRFIMLDSFPKSEIELSDRIERIEISPSFEWKGIADECVEKLHQVL
jgi:hypothetical protein